MSGEPSKILVVDDDDDIVWMITAVLRSNYQVISASEGNARYYADLLQVHLGIVCAALRAAGLWPANVPLLLEAAQLSNLERLAKLARERAEEGDEIHDRLREHRSTLASAEVRRDLLGGILRLRVTAGESWRTVLTPDGERGAISLPAGPSFSRMARLCPPRPKVAST